MARIGRENRYKNMNMHFHTLTLGGTEVTATAAELNAAADITTPGTVEASKGVVVDANKDISVFRTVGVVNLDAGSSGVAGTVDVFPTTAAKGKLAITATANTNNDTLSITNAAQAAARTYTIPDAGASAEFVMAAGAQTVAGAKTFSTMPIIPTATVAATGTVQADAAAITTGFTLVTGADDAKGVKLPAAAAGLVCIIKVGDGADLKVWPNTGDAINAIAANSAMTVVDDVCFMLIALDATTWYSLPLLPS